MDVVLVNPEPLYFINSQRVFSNLGIEVSHELHLTFVGVSSRKQWTQLKDQFNLPQPVEELMDLEADGQIRVLSFSPLLIISRAQLDLLCSKVIDFLFKQHEKHPHEAGISTAQIQKRFLLHPRILALALTNLIRQKRLRENAGVVALSDFQQELTVDEKRQAAGLEELYDKGQFQFESLENLQKSLGIPPGQMEKLVAYLVDQKKIVRAKDEFLLQASWLHDLVARVRSSSRKELTVREFKEITGLSRKYAVPLLELLDEMGVTRRKGAVREIVRDKLSDG